MYQDVDDGVFHCCKLGSVRVGDKPICHKILEQRPNSASPAYLFLAPVQRQYSSIEGHATHAIDAEGKQFVPHTRTECLSCQVMHGDAIKVIVVGSDSLASGLFWDESRTEDPNTICITVLFHPLPSFIFILNIALVIDINPNDGTNCGHQEHNMKPGGTVSNSTICHTSLDQ